MFTQTLLTMSALLGLVSSPQAGPDSGSAARIEVGAREIVVSFSPLRIPGATPYHNDGPDSYVEFSWPEDGWVQGYEIELVDSNGRRLPRQMLHHVGVVNLTRRQLAYPKAERLFAVGRETERVRLPSSMGLRMSENQPLLVYFALVNSTQDAIEDVSLRMSFDWLRDADADVAARRRFYPRRSLPRFRSARSGPGITAVVPLVLNANPRLDGSSLFDVPPGRSVTSAEFSLPTGGRIRALGGHLHDYAVEVRLEDAETNQILVRLRTETDERGQLLAIEQARFPFRPWGLRLDADRSYRIVGVYENPTGATIPKGAMAYMAGPFVPDDPTRWPPIDPSDPVYRGDLSRMTGQSDQSNEHIDH